MLPIMLLEKEYNRKIKCIKTLESNESGSSNNLMYDLGKAACYLDNFLFDKKGEMVTFLFTA